MEIYGIDRSKRVASLIGGSVTAIANIDKNQDGNISLFEGFNATQTIVVKAISTFQGSLADLRNEVTDYSEEEKVELNAILAQELQMRSPKVEALSERAFKLVLDVIDLIIDLQKPEEAFLP